MSLAVDDNELARLILFQGVNPESIRGWMDECYVTSLKEEEVVLSPEEQNKNMYVILEGKVSIHLNQISNDPIAFVHHGECFGEMSVFDGKNPSAYVKTETPVRLLVIGRQTLLNLIDHSHGVSRNLLYLLSNRLRLGNEAVTQSQKLQKEYEQHANVDVLTGLHNRRWINEYFKRVLTRAEVDKQIPVVSLMLIDIDYFKPFNDTYGHLAGDQALKAVADALRGNIRPTDMAARYGGEEFLVILPETTVDQAMMAAERVRKGVEETTIKLNDEQYPGVTISLGITTLVEGDDFDSFIVAADEALYRAKNEGRNRAVLASRSV